MSTNERPGVYTSYEVSGSVYGGRSGCAVGLAAHADAGEAGEVISLSGYAQALESFGGGNIVRLAEVLFRNGAPLVYAVKVDENDYISAFASLMEIGDIKFRVDEFEALCGSGGATVRLGGRGMQALLLDNEAESADYYYADLDYILARHAAAMGIEKIDSSGASGSARRYSVESGVSHWKVLSSFAEFCCGLRPRFAPDGTLVLDGESGGGVYRIDEKSAVISQSYGEDRYGVISSVTVKRRYTNIETETKNQNFEELGGKCIRVINVPKSTLYDAMRHEGEYQIKKSMEGYRTGRVTVADCFPAFPGDKVEMACSPLGLSGHFLVTGTRCCGSGEGVFTEIEMRRI